MIGRKNKERGGGGNCNGYTPLKWMLKQLENLGLTREHVPILFVNHFWLIF